MVAAFAPTIVCVYGHRKGSKYSEVEFHDVNARRRPELGRSRTLRAIEPDVLFVQGASQRQVRMRCYECEVRLECLADALESEANYGVWGGLTERERRAILRHYPHAENWLEWLRTSDESLARELRSPHVPKVLSFVRPQMAGRMEA